VAIPQRVPEAFLRTASPLPPGSAPLQRSAATVARVSRICARPGCRRHASATLSYAYADRVVWVTDLTPDGHPMTHDLCDEHAATIRVPRGWELRDERDTALVLPFAATA